MADHVPWFAPMGEPVLIKGIWYKLNPDFVNRAIGQLSIKGRYNAIAKTAIERTKEILRAV